MSKKFWNFYASGLDSVYHEQGNFSPEYYRMKLALRYLKNKDLRNIVDIGCGTGKFLSLCTGFDKKIGIDFSDRMIYIAKKKYRDIDFSCDSLLTFNTNEKFDVVSAFSVLPYIKNEKSAYLKIKKLLKPNGIFIASYPNIVFNYFTNNNYTHKFMDEVFYDYLDNRKLKNEELSSINKKIKAILPVNSARGKIFLREENPLIINEKISKYGFLVIKKYFLNIHPVRPATMQKFNITKSHPLYIKLQSKLKENWRGIFLGSTFMVICKKQ